MGQPQGAVHQPGGGKAEGRGAQPFRPKGQPGGVGTVGQSGVCSDEHHRRGEGIREAEQGAIHTIPGKPGRQLTAKGVGSQLGQQSRLPAQCGVLAAEVCARNISVSSGAVAALSSSQTSPRHKTDMCTPPSANKNRVTVYTICPPDATDPGRILTE